MPGPGLAPGMPQQRPGEVNIQGVSRKTQVHAVCSLPGARPTLPHKNTYESTQ